MAVVIRVEKHRLTSLMEKGEEVHYCPGFTLGRKCGQGSILPAMMYNDMGGGGMREAHLSRGLQIFFEKRLYLIFNYVPMCGHVHLSTGPLEAV